MADKIKWSQAQTEKLIVMIQQNDCIYNVRSENYLNRTAKVHAFQKICDDMEINNVIEIKEKWKNLRTQYIKEMRDLRASKKSGAGICDLYVPKLWCFSQLNFLEAHTKIRSGQSNIENLSPAPQSPSDTSANCFSFSQLNPESPCSSTADYSVLSPPEVIDITTDSSCSGVSKGPKNKRVKDNALCRLQNDLALLQNKIAEKRSKQFGWLGNIVSSKMEEIIPEQQEDAAWEIQCLLHRLVIKSKNASSPEPAAHDILKNAMSGVFDEIDFE